MNPVDRMVYNEALGETISVPAFYFAKNGDLNDQRIIFAAGFTDEEGTRGRQIINASAITGEVIDSDVITPPSVCDIPHAFISDVAVATDFRQTESGQILGAYFGDTWGNLWRYLPDTSTESQTLRTGSPQLVSSFGCQQPLHFSPAVVQLDRDSPSNRSGHVFLVQATNSPLDKETDGFAPSQLIILKEDYTSGVVTPDGNFGDASTPGRTVLQVGTDDLCAVTAEDGTCERQLAIDARPAGSPTAILKADGSGFQVFSLWYERSLTGCDQGNTYLLLHEVQADGRLNQLKGMYAANEPLVSVVPVGAKIVIATSEGLRDVTDELGQTFQEGASGTDPTDGSGGGGFQKR